MPEFLAVHTLTAPITVEEAVELGRRAVGLKSADAEWIEAWARLDEARKVFKIFCRWRAESAEAVKAALAALPGIPLDGVYPIVVANRELLG